MAYAKHNGKNQLTKPPGPPLGLLGFQGDRQCLLIYDITPDVFDFFFSRHQKTLTYCQKPARCFFKHFLVAVKNQMEVQKHAKWEF